jgi:uracil-DNA glycosylase family 4
MAHVTHAAPFARDRALESAPFYMTRSSGRGVALVPAALPAAVYAADCRRCPRLAAFLDAVHAQHPQYHCRPVPPFGAADARLVIVGLAPGMHGANATGRPFTGDHAGILLYATLDKFGFATAPESHAASDGLRLIETRITNAVKCLPPGNAPLPSEARECNAYLAAEMTLLPPGAAVLALGRIAHDAALRALRLSPRGRAFAHGAEHSLEGSVRLFDSYHCSRYNTNTKRLTTAMFEQVFAAIAHHLGRERPRRSISPTTA